MPKGKRKDFNYFDYFLNTADTICEAAEYLYASLSAFKRGEFKAKADGMHEIESRADGKRREMAKRLIHEFMPPIEREDILALADKLNGVVDAFYSTVRRIYMYNVSVISEGALRLCKLIIKCAAALKEAVTEFKGFKPGGLIREKLCKVNAFESDVDSLHCELMHSLFSTERDTKRLVVWASIYDSLKSCLDRLKDAADTIEKVIIKDG